MYCVCVCVYLSIYTCRSAGYFQELVLSIYHVVPGIELRSTGLAASAFTHLPVLLAPTTVDIIIFQFCQCDFGELFLCLFPDNLRLGNCSHTWLFSLVNTPYSFPLGFPSVSTDFYIYSRIF